MRKLKNILVSIVLIFMIIMSTNITEATSKTMSEINAERSNNYLTSLVVEGYELSKEFNKFNQTYYITVPSSVKSVNITATTENPEAKYRVSGNNLTKNESTINVVVTSQNRLTRTYKIIAVKQVDNGLKLSSLDIEGVKFDKEFSSDNYYYKGTATFNQDETELKINAVSNIPEASIEILGSKAVYGENFISIILRNGDKTTIYQIELDVNVEKTITSEIKNNNFFAKVNDKWTEIKAKIAELVKDENKMMSLLIALAVVLLLIISILIIKISRRKKVNKNKEKLKKRAK